jgi:hypothetical protein
MALPLANIVNAAIPVVALPLNAGKAAPLPAPDPDEVEYFMTLFEHYTQQQLEKETASRNKARQASAVATLAARGKAILEQFFKKKVEAGGAAEVQAMVETAFGAAEAPKPSITDKLRQGANEAMASASKILSDFWTAASAKANAAGPKAKEWLQKAGPAFVALWGIITNAFYRVKSWKPDLSFLANIERIGVIKARYGEVVLPGAGGLRLNANTNRYFLVDRYREFNKDELKSELAKFSSKYSLSNATKSQLEGVVKRMMLDRANGRFIKNRYAGNVKKLISNENWNKIKKGETTLQQTLARLKLPTGNGNRVGRLNTRYTLATRAPLTPAQQKSMTNIMSNVDFQAALGDLVTQHGLLNIKNIIQKKAVNQGSINSAKAYVARLRSMSKLNALKNIYGVRLNNQARLEDLLAMRTRGNWTRLHPNLKKQVNDSLRNKLYRRGSSMNSGNFDYPTLAIVMRAINSAETVGNVPGATTYVESLKRAINRLGSRSNSVRVNENRLSRIIAAAGRVRKVTSVTNAIRNAQTRIARLRREENASRRNRGQPPLAGYNNRGSSRIPYYPSNARPTSYGNMRPLFAPQPNRPQPGVVPQPPPLEPFPAIPANNRSRQTPPPPMPNMRPENLLPPTEAAAVNNAGGINKALNLVENAGGPSNIVKTANILKNVGNNPNAAVAAGANAKNVKIVLQLGGANNALKVASAVPKLKKRRRSKAKKAAPKPKAPRVKELKKLIKFLGTKEELVKKLPDPENKEKKLTKNQVVAKITTHLLRKGRKAKK